MPKRRYITLLLLLTALAVRAQSLYHVSHTTGKQIIGGIEVAVISLNGAYPYPPGNYCGSGPFFIGQLTSGATTSGYKFVFSKAINAARFQITASEPGEVISFEINQVPYPLSSSQVSNYVGSCGNQNNWLVTSGLLTYTASNSNNSQVYIQDSIRDITITDINYSAGSVFSFDFLLDTTVVLDSIYEHNLCVNDTLKIAYTATGTFSPGNQFKLQLSDKNGSFSNPTDLTTITSISSGVFSGIVPALPSGDGYRLRVVSTSPIDTSASFPNRNGIYIGNPPLIQAYNNGPGCEGDTLKVGVYEFSHVTNEIWNGPGLLPNFYTQVASLYDVKLADSGWYYVEVIDYGCSAVDSTFLIINPNPVHAISSTNSPVCEGDTIKLLGNISNATNTWFHQTGMSMGGKDVIIPKAQLSDSGMFVLVTTLNGCSSKDTAYMVVKPTPIPNAGVNNPVCNGEKLMLSTNCNVKNSLFIWKGPNGFTCYSADTIIDGVNFVYNGTYLVTASKNGCATTDTLKIKVNPYPNYPKAVHSTPLCEHGAFTLGIDSVETGVNYSWTGPDGFISNSIKNTLSNISDKNSGKYIVIADISGCSRKDTLDISVTQNPETPIISSNSPVRNGGSIQLQVANPVSGIVYQWMGPYGFETTEVNPVINNVTTDNSGKYILTANFRGCYSGNYLDVLVDNLIDTGIIVLYPNANDGNFTVKLLLHEDKQLALQIVDEIGHQLYYLRSETKNNAFEYQFNLKGQLASGIYTLRLIYEREIKNIPFVIDRQ